jgi:MFS superfamily sulfate permease-like transporter
MRQVSKMDCLVWLATFLGCLFISIDAGLGLGIALGLLFLFVRTAFPRMHILHRLPGSTFFRDAAMYRLQVGTCRHLPDSAVVLRKDLYEAVCDCITPRPGVS